MAKVMDVPGLSAHREEGWIAVIYKVVKPRPRLRFSVKRVPVALVSLLYPSQGETPDIRMERLALSENSGKKGVLGLRLTISAREDLLFFAPDGVEFSYRGTKLRGPVAYLQH